MMIRRIGCAPLAFAVWLAWSVSGAPADQKSEKHQQAQELVREALHREIYGAVADRQELLQSAMEHEPNYAPARWHQGYVWFRNQWVKSEQVASDLATDRRWKEYERKREEADRSVASQASLAVWCEEESLDAQARSHWTQVLMLEPNHSHARRALGFRRMGDRWVSEQEIAAGREHQDERTEALREWRSELLSLQRGLEQRSLAKQEAAAEKIRGLDDPSAIAAMEVEISNRSEYGGLLVVEALQKMNDFEAAMSLGRHAVLSPFPKVRAAAAEALRERPLDDFAPMLLAEMYTPVQSRVEVIPGRRLVLRESFVRESQEEHQLLVQETEYERVGVPGGNRQDTLRRAMADARQRATARQQQAQRQNFQTAQLNSRISAALNVATGQQLPSDPATWWNWWNDHNEVYLASAKPTTTRFQSDQVSIADDVSQPSFGGTGGSLAGAGTPGRCDCLAAGTPVWTARGTQAIQDLRPGDMVLSQHPETGELTYQPVLRTTVRPASPLVVIQAEDDQFQTSGGHLFWVSGEGWVKARDLKPGMELHAETKTVRVNDVQSGSTLETYNLVVENFHSYFVGYNKVLCHDNTVRRPTNSVVPGLIRP